MARFVSFENVCQLQEKLGSIQNSNLVDVIEFIESNHFFLSDESTFDLIDSLALFFNAKLLTSDELSLILIQFQVQFTKFFEHKNVFSYYPYETHKYFVLHFTNMGIITLKQQKNLSVNQYFSPELNFTFHHRITNDFNTDAEFFQFRQDGYNHFPICQFIRNDDLEGFTNFLITNSLHVDCEIPPTLFERYDMINKRGLSMLEYSAFFKAVNIFKYLILHQQNIPQDLAKYAVAGGEPEIIQICQEKGLSFDDTIEMSIQFKHDDMFEYLTNDFPPTLEMFQMAFKHFNCSLIKKLIFNLFDDSEGDQKAEMIRNIVRGTIASGHISLLIFEIANGLTEYIKNELFTMIDNHRLSMLEFIFRYITNFDSINSPNCEHDNMRLIDYSLKKDMNCFQFLCGVKEINLNGLQITNQEAPIIRIARMNKANLFEAVLTRIAYDEEMENPNPNFDINSENDLGETALHIACGKGNLAIVKMIVSYENARIDHQTIDGKTPLHYAAMNGYLEVVTFLVSSCGANKLLRDSEGLAPVDYAERKRYNEIVKFLAGQRRDRKKVRNSNKSRKIIVHDID